MNEENEKTVANEALDDFDARLSKANKLRESRQPKQTANTGAHMAYRIAMELVVATVVGGLIGWYLDKQFDTKPWLMLVFLLFGIAAGFKNVFRLASNMTTTGSGEENEKDETEK